MNQRYRPILLAFSIVLLAAGFAAAEPYQMVVVNPGGPSPSEQAQQQVDRMAKEVGVAAGWPESATSASYFNDSAAALAFIQQSKPGFVLGTPGFYLKYRKELKLSLFCQALLSGASEGQYFVVAKKDSFAALADLKGKTLAGTHLNEPEFVQRVVFEGKLDPEVKTKSMRSLRALRRLTKGEVDAVLLDAKEHAGMGTLEFAKSLVTIYQSKPIPNAGFMVVSGNVAPQQVKALAKALGGFCEMSSGTEICRDFDISGFKPATDATLSGIVKLYEGK
jgi:ABC transporter, phosphonate, periplasmic substrate-binding protein